MRPLACLTVKPGKKTEAKTVIIDKGETMKKANVTIYGTVQIHVFGAEGETRDEILEEAVDAIDDRVVDGINKVYVDPQSLTAKNLLGEVSYVCFDKSQPERFVMLENAGKDSEKECFLQMHPLLNKPVEVAKHTDKSDLNAAAFELLKEFMEKEQGMASGIPEMNDWIAKVEKLITEK